MYCKAFFVLSLFREDNQTSSTSPPIGGFIFETETEAFLIIRKFAEKTI